MPEHGIRDTRMISGLVQRDTRAVMSGGPPGRIHPSFDGQEDMVFSTITTDGAQRGSGFAGLHNQSEAMLGSTGIRPEPPG